MAITPQDLNKAVITSVGLAIGGGTANSARPVIAGTATAGMTIDVFDGVRMIGTAIANANGVWSFTPPADLKAGSHSFTAIAVDSNGDFGTSSTPMSVTVPSGTPVAPAKPIVDGMTDDAGHALTNPTNDAHPTMNGTGTPGDTITLYDGATPVGSAIIDGTGHWVVKPSKDLNSGTHDFYVIETNPAKVPSVPSDHYSVVIDTSIPAAPVITSATDAVGPVQGLIPAGGTTDDDKPTFAGTGVKGDIVKLYDNGTLIGSAVVDSNGKWSIKPANALSNGVHDFFATDTNTLGTTSGESTHFKFILDTTTPATPAAPTLTDDNGATIPPGSTTADAHPHINGAGVAGDIIKVYDNGNVIGSTTVGGDGKWSFTPSTDLSNGTHSITVVDVNAAGTPSAASGATGVVIVAGTPATPNAPSLTDDNANAIPAGSTTYDAHPHINGTGTAGDIIKVYDGSTLLGSTTVAGNGQWTFTPSSDLSTGSHSLNVTETNAAGTPSAHSPSIAFSVNPSLAYPMITSIVDSVGPIQGNIAQNGTTDDPRPVFHGTGVAGDVVKLWDGSSTVIGSTVVDASGHWTLQPATNLSNGVHSFLAFGTLVSDWLGSWNITVDTTTPATPATPTLTDDNGASIPAGSTTTDNHPHINGTGKAGDIITVYDGNTVLGSTTIGSNGQWTFTPGNMSTGSHSINVTETNAAGAPSAHSGSIGFTYSNVVAPAVITGVTDAVGPIQGPVANGGVTDDNHPTISGTGIAGYQVLVYQNGYGCGSVIVDATGHWSLKITGGMSEGLHNMTVTQGPVGGAASASSNTWAITIDTSTPATPATPTLTDDNGATIPAGSTTADNHPHINGTGKAGDIITVYDGNTVLGSTTIGSNGQWTFTPGNMSTGSHSINVTETNAAGTSSAHSGSTSFTYSTVPTETVTISYLLDHLTVNYIYSGGSSKDTAPTVTGTLSSGLLAGETLVVYRDGYKLAGAASVSGTSWSYLDSGLGVGSHSYQARVESSTGNGPTSNLFIFNEISAAPVVPTETVVITNLIDDSSGYNVNVYTGGSTKDTTPAVAGTLSSGLLAGETVAVYRDGSKVGSATVSGTGWTFQDSGLGLGSHFYEARVESSTGAGPTSNTFTFNEIANVAAAPVITQVLDSVGAATGPVPNNGTTDDNHPTISGTGIAGDTIYIYQNGAGCGETTVAANGTWSLKLTGALSDGKHDMTAVQFLGDQAHSSASNTWTINVDTAIHLPTETVQITSLTDHSSGANIPAGGSTKDTAPVVHGSVTSALQSGETLVVYRDGYKVGNASMSGTSWTFNDSGVAVGNHTYTARVENSAGSGAYSAGYSFTEAAAVQSYKIGVATRWGWDGINESSWVHSYAIYVPGYTLVSMRNSYGTFPPADIANGEWVFVHALSDLAPSSGQITLTVRDANGVQHTVITTYAEVKSHDSTPPGYAHGPAAGYSAFVYFNTAVLSAQRDLTQTESAIDDTVHTDALVTSDVSAHHVAVGEHDTFTGTTGHDTVDLNVDPASYFKESSAHIQGSTVHPVEAADAAPGAAPAVNTLHLTGDHQILDLTSLTGKTATAKISGMEVIDLGGHENTVKLSLTDVLNLGEQDLFVKDGKQQMMINGSDGDKVDLSNAHIAGVADGQWQQEGTAVVGGVTYNVYEHSGAHTELLIQQGVQIVVH